MQQDPRYDDVVSEVKAFLEERLAFAVREGIPVDRIWLDPGIGFGKTLEHNLQLLRRLPEIAAIGRPVVVGASRKRFIGSPHGAPGGGAPGGGPGGRGRRRRARSRHGAGARRRPDQGGTYPRRRCLGRVYFSPTRSPIMSDLADFEERGARVEEREEEESRADPAELVCDGRDLRPLRVHPSWGDRVRAAGGPAAHLRHQLRGRGLDATVTDSSRTRSTTGPSATPSPSGDRALLRHPRASLRRTGGHGRGPSLRRGGHGARDEARAAVPAAVERSRSRYPLTRAFLGLGQT